MMQLMLSNEDLKEIGLPMGPRKKLSGFILEWNQRKQIEEVTKPPFTLPPSV